MDITITKVKNWILQLNEKIQDEKMYLTELDQAIGDGDHGLNMARGFEEAVNRIDQGDFHDLGQLFKTVAMALLSKVGGASGPLYGTVFMKMSSTLNGKSEVSIKEFSQALKDGLDGLKMRGKAEVGEKTMVDVWEPVVRYLLDSEKIDTKEIKSLAKMRMESTKDLEAKKGRASYLGKRSIGHIDPGSRSSYLFFATLADAIDQGESAE